jgi:quercetin dioxygenase-like cupin family protein
VAEKEPSEDIMNRTFFSVVFVIVVVASGMTFAHRHEDGESVREISVQNIKEKLDGKDMAVTFVEVTIEPLQAGLPHRHPGSAFVYVLEGEYELGIDDEPTKVFKAGETFCEPSGCLHRVSKNPSKKGRTRLIAVVLHPRDAKEVAIPMDEKELHR